MDINATELLSEERLPWHKPELRRLTVNVDTQQFPFSGADGLAIK